MARKKSRSQIWLEYIFVRAFFGFFSLLPRRLSIGAAILLARLAYAFLGKLRRVGMRNLEIAFPEKTVAEREKILRGSFDNLGRVLGEVSQFPRYTPEKIARIVDFSFEGRDRAEFDEKRAAGRGTIFLSPHLGNWEMLVLASSALHEPISYLARPLDNPLIEDMTHRLRTTYGNVPLNKTNSVRRAMTLLREGKVVGILADVNAHPKEGVFVDFFGVPACTTAGAATLAMRTDAMMIPMCAVWDAQEKRYKVLTDGILDPVRTGDREQDLILNTANFTAVHEKFVRAYPEQWLWIHKRWKTRPPGEKDLYENL